MSEQFSDASISQLWDDSSMRPYLSEIRRRHGIVEVLALPSMRDLPPLRIESLFVSPLLAESSVSPDSDPDQWPQGQNLLEAFKESNQLIVLGDPGGGKTTLSNWLAWRLSAGLTSALPSVLENRVPLPCVLRDIPSDVFNANLSLADLAEYIAKRLLGEKASHDFLASLRARVEAGAYVLILDGVDEIPISSRKDVRAWMMQAHDQKAPVLATSRIVGYDDYPVDQHKSDKTPLETLEEKFDKALEKTADIPSKNLKLTEKTASKNHEPQWAKRRYLVPFNQARIEAFAEKWYLQRCGSELEAREKTIDLLSSLGQSEVTQQLARTPNLLSLMAIVHRERAHLPDGKALLYDEIANAYINTIDSHRHILQGDALAPYGWKQRKAWLAYVGFQMQLRRSSSESADRNDGVLVDKSDVLQWLATAMQNSGVPHADKNAHEFLSWVARRSGLLLPRGEDRYAFVHLSFQEFFCAHYLKSQVVSPTFIRKGKSSELSQAQLKSWSADSVWRETLICLFEILSAEHDSDWVDDLVDILFAGEQQLLGASVELAGRVLLDKHIRLSEQYEYNLVGKCSQKIKEDTRFFRHQEHKDLLLPLFLKAGYVVIIQNYSENEPSDDVAFPNEWVSSFQDIKLKSKVCMLFVRGDLSIDITQLSELTNLRSVSLENTQISDIKPLAKLTHLTSLNLNNSQVSDIKPLAELKSLTSLNFNHTQVSDIKPLAKLTNLTWVQLNHTQVSDIAALAKLRNMIFLFIQDTPLADIKPLSKLSKLMYLRLDRTQVSDIQPLSRLSHLRYLYLNGTQVSDIKPLAKLSMLSDLNLERTQVSDIKPLAKLSDLRLLYLTGTQVSDIKPLAKLSHLRHLDLNGTQVSNIKPLAKLNHLRYLDLNGTQVSDIKPLAKLSDLTITGIEES